MHLVLQQNSPPLELSNTANAVHLECIQYITQCSIRRRHNNNAIMIHFERTVILYRSTRCANNAVLFFQRTVILYRSTRFANNTVLTIRVPRNTVLVCVNSSSSTVILQLVRAVRCTTLGSETIIWRSSCSYNAKTVKCYAAIGHCRDYHTFST